MLEYKAKTNYFSTVNTIIDNIDLTEYINKSNCNATNAWINFGPWQSWNPGFEIPASKKQPSLRCKVLKPFNNYLEFPGSVYKESKNTVLAQFIFYLRWDNYYLCLVSTGNIENELPPVQFVINKKENKVSIELCDIGKNWQKDELQAQINIFTTESYFELKDKLEALFGSSNPSSPNYTKRFDQIQFLGQTAAGWESWYNHYSKIDEKLILEDLDALKETPNILNQCNFQKIVFQVDDGWEQTLGNWEINNERFPHGLKSITEKINSKGYIPGLWIAPFIIDLRSPIAIEHPDWILKNNKGKPYETGFNPLWGALFGTEQPGFPGSFYCLDLSIPEVIEYLDSVIETAIENWGFRYLKLDFLYAGMLNGTHKNPGASYEFYINAINKLTRRSVNSKGENVAYLGCGAPFELSFKNFPLCRIGCDTYEHWINKQSKALCINGRNEAFLNLKDTIGRAYWDKIIYANDPDVIFIRNENCSLTKNQKILIATVAAMFGSQIMYSDDPASSNSEEEVEFARLISELINKYQNEEFSVKNIAENIFEVHSKSGKYNGILNLEEGYADIQ